MSVFLTARETLVLRRRSGAYRPGRTDTTPAHPNTREELALRLKLSLARIREIEGRALVHLGLPVYTVDLDTPAGQAKVVRALSDDAWAQAEERDDDELRARRG